MNFLSIAEQMEIISQCENIELWRTVGMIGCLVIAAIGFCFLIAKCFVPCWEQLRKFASLPRIQQFVLGICIVGLVQYGATKQGWTISFDNGIKQNPIQPSSVTNNTVSIHWTRDTAGGIYVPENAAVYIDYRPVGSTNEWGLLAQSVVSAWSWTGEVNNATGFCYNVWAYYIPPEPVHTNGVWVYKTLKDRQGKFAIPLRTRIEVNGKAIATPKEKRKDEE